jgi:hypothetical protein
MPPRLSAKQFRKNKLYIYISKIQTPLLHELKINTIKKLISACKNWSSSLRLNFWGRFQRLFDAYQSTWKASAHVNFLPSKPAKQFHINILCVSAKYADDGAEHGGRNCTFILRVFGDPASIGKQQNEVERIEKLRSWELTCSSTLGQSRENFFQYLPHGEKGEEPSDQGSGVSSWKAISAPDTDVMDSRKHGSKSNHRSHQRSLQKVKSRRVTYKTHTHTHTVRRFAKHHSLPYRECPKGFLWCSAHSDTKLFVIKLNFT